MPTTVIDVAAYIHQKTHTTSKLYLHKLVYYTQAWTLAWTGRPAFTGDIEAWKYGPVSFELYRHAPISQHGEHGAPLPPSIAAGIDRVLQAYSRYAPSELVDLTHNEAPWINAWNRCGHGRIRHEIIPQNDMRDYYAQQLLEGRGIQAPPDILDHCAIDKDKAAARGMELADKWQTTLDWLADK